MAARARPGAWRYKRHIAIADRFVVATAVEPANVPESLPAERHLAWSARDGAVDILDIDRG
jgi:hypothetical protein